jgi:hypothetical protein
MAYGTVRIHPDERLSGFSEEPGMHGFSGEASTTGCRALEKRKQKAINTKDRRRNKQISLSRSHSQPGTGPARVLSRTPGSKKERVESSVFGERDEENMGGNAVLTNLT